MRVNRLRQLDPEWSDRGWKGQEWTDLESSGRGGNGVGDGA